jgi:ABC-type multidrug transport system fused ATPase/permease subunit
LKKKLFSDELKWALSYLKPYIWGLIGVFILSFGGNYSFALLPKFSTKFLFELLTPEKIHELYKYFFIAVGLIIGRAFFTFLKKQSMKTITHSSIKKIRDQFFGHLMAMDIDYFTKNKTGKMISIAITDVETIRTDFYQDLINFFSHIMMLIIILVRLFLLNWQLTLISFGVMPILYWVVKVMGNKMRSVSRKVRENLSDLSTNLHEILTGIEVVKAFAQEEREINVFKQNTKRYKRTFLRLSQYYNLFGPLNEVIVFIFGMILVGIGSIFIIRGEWSVKLLTEYLMLLGIIVSPITKIPKFISEFKIATTAIERIRAISSVKPRVKEIENPVKKTIEGKVEFKNVWFSYNPPQTVLQNVSFNSQKGEIVALVGPSGGGKTTIARLIPRFYDCDSGGVYIDGINVKEYSLSSLRSQIGIVSQNVVLFNTTVAENIKYPKSDAAHDEVIKAAEMAYAYDFIMELPNQFDTNVGEKGVKLSGGQKQRIAIARTILTNPHLLILDEATSSLDSESEYYIQLAIKNLMEGRTTVTIAHRLSTITHAHKILVIEKGKIIDVGTHDELINTCDLYKRIYDLQYFR